MPTVEITIKGRDLISVKGYLTSNLRHLSCYGRLRTAPPPASSGAERALTAVPWAVTSAGHQDRLPVLSSQWGSCLRPRNDMETPVMLTLIGGRWRRRGVTRWHFGLGMTSSRGGGGSDAPLAKATSGAAPWGSASPPLPNGGARAALLQLGIGDSKVEAVARFFWWAKLKD
jgi:hypothetical protein